MRGFFDPRDEAIEVMIKKMFEQARGDCRPQVLVVGCAPAPDEAPDRLPIIFDESSLHGQQCW